MPTNRVPLVCTPEEFVLAVRLVQTYHGMAQHQVASIPAVAALFRPAEEPDMPDHPMPLNDNVRKALKETINRHSRENRSDTPDFLLADYLLGCLETFESVTRARDAWHGFKPFGGAHTVPAPAAPPWDDGLTATERERLLRRATMEVDLGGLPLRQPIETLFAAPPPAGEPARAFASDSGARNYVAEVAALRAENERLTGAIRWALGEGDSDFGDQLPPDRHPGDGQKPRIPPYWWRTHLRRKAGLVPPGENRSEG